MDTLLNKYKINRYDLSEDRSLRPWSAADEYLLQTISDLEQKPDHLGLYNDRFGYLSIHLHRLNPVVIIANKSEEKAIRLNAKANDVALPTFSDPLSSIDPKMDCVLLKIPKSLGLFQLYLEQITHNSTNDVHVICAFMTRHFSPRLLQIAEEYFEIVEQSKALKKARLLILRKKKKTAKKNLITSIDYKGQAYKQYLGVFSADHIDYATQFFIDHLDLNKTEQRILDLGSGNGVLAKEIFNQHPGAEIHLMDDSFLSVSSAELNIKGENIHHHFNNDLSIFDDQFFDLIVTNPPFHFEYEINIQIALALFKDCFRCLKEGGNFQVVANKHLNYKVHLNELFKDVQVVAEDKKFIIYKCIR